MFKMRGKETPPLYHIKTQRVFLKILNCIDKSKFTDLFSYKIRVY